MVTRRATTGQHPNFGGIPEIDADLVSSVVRKRSKKCSVSVFETISEQGDLCKDSGLMSPVSSYDESNTVMKSSKKVSIAENLNCDYSDDNITDNEETVETQIHHTQQMSLQVESDIKHRSIKVFRERWNILLNFIIKMIVTALLVLVSGILNHPRLFAVIMSSLIVTNLILSVTL